MKFTPFPEINTPKLVLRKIEESDHAVILFLRTDKTVNQYIHRPENKKIRTEAGAISFIKEINENIILQRAITWGITLKHNPELIGTICLWNFSHNRKIAEIGYDLHPAHHQKGIMSEAMKSVLDFGFNTAGFSKIEAFTHKDNESSIKLLEKNGFRLLENRKDEDNIHNLIFERKPPG